MSKSKPIVSRKYGPSSHQLPTSSPQAAFATSGERPFVEPGRRPSHRYPCDTELPDGTAIHLRLVEPGDKGTLQDMFARLSPESRYRRFLGITNHLSSRQLSYFTEIDYENHFALGALALDHEPPLGIGVGRYIRFPGEPELAEPAFAVVDAYQHRGLGRLLLEQLMVVAREHGIACFRATLLADNTPMKKLFARQGAHFTQQGQGVLTAEFALPGATALGESRCWSPGAGCPTAGGAPAGR